MKHLKTFENISTQSLYNVGDYVYVWKQVSKKKIITSKVKIIEVEYIDSLSLYQYFGIDGIHDDTPIGDTGSIISKELCFLEQDIKRKLNPYEIEQLEIKLKSNKYNL